MCGNVELTVSWKLFCLNRWSYAIKYSSQSPQYSPWILGIYRWLFVADNPSPVLPSPPLPSPSSPVLFSLPKASANGLRLWTCSSHDAPRVFPSLIVCGVVIFTFFSAALSPVEQLEVRVSQGAFNSCFMGFGSLSIWNCTEYSWGLCPLPSRPLALKKFSFYLSWTICSFFQ